MRDRMQVPPGQWKGPGGGPFEVPAPRGFGGYTLAHALYPWLFLLLFATLVGLAIFALVRFSKQMPRSPAPPPPGADSPGGRIDPALEELRIRYARGDIDRDEYLKRAADLRDS